MKLNPNAALFFACFFLSFANAQSPTNTSTTMASSPNPSGAGYPVAFTAVVTGNGVGITNGFVRFVEGTTTLANVALDANGRATFSTNSLGIGAHTIRADYSGNVNPPLGSSSAVMVHSVVGVPSTTVLSNPSSMSVANPYPSTIEVSNVLQSVSRVTVTLHNVTGNLGEFDVILVSPTGAASYVLSDAGTGVSGVTLTFADDAANGISGSPPSGSYKPTNIDGGGSAGRDAFPAPAPPPPWATSFAIFNGAEPNGTWKLFYTTDTGPGGTIAGGWTLTLETIPISTREWDGGGNDANWTTAANWVGDVAPVAGDALVFPPGAARAQNNNDFATLTLFGPVTFSGSNYTVSGNSLRTKGGIAATQISQNNVVDAPVIFHGSQAVFVSNSVATLQLNGGLNEWVGMPIAKTGNGTLVSSGGGSLGGPLSIDAGIWSPGDGSLRQTWARPLIIRDGAIVRLLYVHQINDASTVEIYGNGLLDLNGFTDHFADLKMTGGAVLGDLICGRLTANSSGAIQPRISGSLRLYTGTFSPFVISNNASSLRITGPIGFFANATGLTLGGTGVTIFDGPGTNTYPGTTLVTSGTLILGKSEGGIAIPGNLTVGDGLGGLSADITRVNASYQIGRTSAVEVATSGQLDLGDHSETIGTLSGAGLITLATPSTLAIGREIALSSTFSGTINGSGGLTKFGTSTLHLTGTNGFSGPTTISNGTLVVNGANPASAVILRGGRLSGVGSVAGITGYGGRIAPGGNVGALEVNGALICNAGAILEIEVTGSAPPDQLRVFGSVALGGCTLSANAISALDTVPGYALTIIENDGSDPVVGTFNGLAEGAEMLISGVPFRITYSGGTGNDVVLTQAPFSNTTANLIPPIGQSTLYPWPINVAGIGGIIGKVTVMLSGVSHTRPDDLDILLQAPSGQIIVLMSDAGGDETIVNTSLVFGDAAPGLLPDAGAITSGSYRPTNYEGADVLPSPAPAPPHANSLGVLKGTNPNGTWWLWLADDTDGDMGSVASWSLNIVPGVQRLAIARSPQGIVLSWPTQPGGYALQSAQTLSGPWQTITNPPTIIGGQYTVTLPVTTDSFYRLMK